MENSRVQIKSEYMKCIGEIIPCRVNIIRLNLSQQKNNDKCVKTFALDRTLKQNIEDVHEGQKNYKCDHCGESFSKIENVKKHKKSVHKNECKHCLKYFKSLEKLKNHIKIVHEDRTDIKCDICGKYFTELRCLKRHIRIFHKGRREQECKDCEKSFHNLSQLKLHTKTAHEVQQNHKCDHCEKSFNTGYYLKKHIKAVHEGQKQCDHCGKSFSKIDYVNHCNKSICTSEYLEKHIQSVHEGHKIHKHVKAVHEGHKSDEKENQNVNKGRSQRRQECKYCWKYFDSSRFLMYHIKAAHEPKNSHSDFLNTIPGDSSMNEDENENEDINENEDKNNDENEDLNTSFGQNSSASSTMGNWIPKSPSIASENETIYDIINISDHSLDSCTGLCISPNSDKFGSSSCSNQSGDMEKISHGKFHMSSENLNSIDIKKKYKCEHCEQTFFEFFNLKKHIKRIHVK